MIRYDRIFRFWLIKSPIEEFRSKKHIQIEYDRSNRTIIIIILLPPVIRKLQQQARLADLLVAYDDEFE